MSQDLSVRGQAAVAVGQPEVGRPATATRTGLGAQPERRRKAFDRPRFLPIITGLVFVYFFAPIVVVLVFSFNSAKSLQVFRSFSLTWYSQFLHDPDIMASVVASLEIAAATMVVATVLGTLLAFGLLRSRSRVTKPTDLMMLLNLVSPEIVTGIAALLVFTQLGLTLSVGTVVLAHVTFSIAYVTIIVRSRLSALNRETEEAAMDLGATHLEALRLVTLPLLWPAILASGMLVFVLSFDDFVTSYFTSGTDVSPLPVRIYSMIRNGVTPEINAIGAVMMLVTISIVLLAMLLYSSRQTKAIDLMTAE